MKELSLEKMEQLNAGGWLDCAGAALGVVGLAVSIASIPVTGPIGVGAAVGIAAGSIGTGISLHGCASGFIPYLK